MISHTGKKQDVSLRGGVRIEQDNDRIVYTVNNKVARIDYPQWTSFFDVSNGKEMYRTGLLPDGTWGWVVAKEGEDIKDAFTP